MKDRLTKKQLSVSMYDRGMNVVAIARLLRCEPSYVANSLIDQGRLPAYVDLYTSTGPQNEDAKELEGVLKLLMLLQRERRWQRSMRCGSAFLPSETVEECISARWWS